MKQISVAEILELPVQERIRLVELIWESIAAVPEAVEVTPEIKAELEERLKEFEADPEAGYSWEQVKSHLRNGTWRSGYSFLLGRCVKWVKRMTGTNCEALALGKTDTRKRGARLLTQPGNAERGSADE